MIIAVDAMGGDYAPAEIVKGAVEGSRLHGVDVVLVGDEDAIRRHLPSECARSSAITIRHAADVIGMDEHVEAVRTRKDASVVVAAALVKEGKADAMVSMGNTAAAMAVATLRMGRIRRIDRPAIATLLPTTMGVSILLDAGAVADCSVENLRQFAVMGSVYAEKVLSISNPRVGLLSIGEEKSKGNELVRGAYEALSTAALNFIGNVEGRDLFSGAADVIVADGFTGNVALKAAEGLAEHVERLIKDDLRAHPLAKIPIALMFPFLKRIKKKLDYSEYGGAPLLGLDGICIIGHGRSNARAVANAVRAAKEAVSGNVVSAIWDSITAGEPAARV
ncbi:MAG: phosphate acyltransferase PlsX [Armatimonadetes bacterium]|nr:phosphate acyltransferase PlsX [Armatimonadota bacterium]